MFKQVMEMYELLDKATANGNEVEVFLRSRGAEDVIVQTVSGEKGSTDFIKIFIKGSEGKNVGGDAPTLGITGRLGGLGARPEVIGFVSDGDGALAALSAALKLIDMQKNGDVLKGDVVITTHICPDAPTREHFPVRFMGSAVDIETMNNIEVTEDMDAILSIDTTKGNKVINTRGFAISSTVKEGYILKISDDLTEIMMRTTGRLPYIFPLSQQDITPYGNGLYHLNSILQPAVAAKVPVVGVAITTEVPVAGCATGATHLMDIEMTARFAIEVAKDFGEKKCKFYDEEEYKLIHKLYGDMKRFQTRGVQ
ncbi:DUF1177 domain-containing protein [Crassaminicella profunda]|uniref:DUF1177 domain-containing protein n=1 Tax=Crassaminicella profunda TaxID=1286698 RepID=UPI001CA62779|nr:DUF1177 domain-containing protein [Crassaminicella profunda]QZY56625.1 DUF1177 domain-containing protein [Crassaminicella profunda]